MFVVIEVVTASKANNCPDQENERVRKGMKGKMIVRNRVEERGVSSKGSIEYKLMNI